MGAPNGRVSARAAAMGGVGGGAASAPEPTLDGKPRSWTTDAPLDVASCSSLPISPTGIGPLSDKISVVSDSSAGEVTCKTHAAWCRAGEWRR